MTAPFSPYQVLRIAHRVTSIVWLAWATYRFSVDPLAHDEFARAAVRVSTFVVASVVLALYGALLSRIEEEEDA